MAHREWGSEFRAQEYFAIFAVNGFITSISNAKRCADGLVY